MSPEQLSLPPKSVRLPAEFRMEGKANSLWGDGLCQIRSTKRGSNPSNASQAHISQEGTSGAWDMIRAGNDASDRFDARYQISHGLDVSVVFDICQPEADFGHRMRSGGDFADVIPLHGDWVALVLADVCGKGPAAALCVPQTIYAVRQILYGSTNDCRNPACVLNRLNRHLCSPAQPPVCASAALTLVFINTGTGEALSASAGSEPPLILRAGGQAEAVGAGRIALGVEAGRTYHAVDFQLERGDALLLATDGITLAQSTDSDEGENSLNYEGLTGLALNAFGMGSLTGRVARAVLNGARAFAGGTFHDHATVLVASLRQAA